MDNGIQFEDQPRNRDGWTARLHVHRFDMICNAYGIEHRLTKPNPLWTNGPPLGVCRQTPAGQRVERMNRTIKEATVKRYHYDDQDHLRNHLALFIDTYNNARRLKALKGLTPAQFIWTEWQAAPETFIREPCRLILGLYT